MRRLVVDASSIGNILLSDEHDGFSESLLNLVLQADLVEPAHWPIESCGLLLKAARHRRLSAKDRDNALAEAVRIIALAEVEAVSRIKAVVALALEHHITIYDAAYLELASRLETPLLTRDQGLLAAAAKANVPTVSVS